MSEGRRMPGAEILLMIACTVVFVFYMPWAGAFALMHIWDWFRPDLFPPLSFKSALGLAVLVNYFTAYNRMTKKAEDDPDRAWRLLILSAAYPWIAMGTAAFIRWVWL